MSVLEAALLLGAGLAAGAVNAVGGGGTLISFPALLAVGLSPLSANATNIVAVLPGYAGSVAAYRPELHGQGERARRLSLAGAVGAAAGAVLLLVSSEEVFEAVVPFLVLAACALLAAGPLLSPGRGERRGLAAAVFAAAIYGGYFGAALGVMLLAVLGALTDAGLQRSNALKALLSLVIGAVAAVLLAVFGPVAWGEAAVVAAGALIGGRLGGGLARRLDPAVLRWAVVALGVGVAVSLLI